LPPLEVEIAGWQAIINQAAALCAWTAPTRDTTFVKVCESSEYGRCLLLASFNEAESAFEELLGKYSNHDLNGNL
jgi:hypothetical protein